MKYNTKQKKALLDYLETARGRHVTVAEIRAHFEAQGCPIGTTTLYRQMDELVHEGVLRKYIVDENSAACYEYTGEEPSEEPIVHCKCEGCGKLLHIHCGQFASVQEHLSGGHGFAVNPRRTVLYGLCGKCRKLEVRK